jgi:hypothetical protein
MILASDSVLKYNISFNCQKIGSKILVPPRLIPQNILQPHHYMFFIIHNHRHIYAIHATEYIKRHYMHK